MTVGQLIDLLAKWPSDVTVQKSDDLGNFHDIGTVDENTAYNQQVVVID